MVIVSMIPYIDNALVSFMECNSDVDILYLNKLSNLNEGIITTGINAIGLPISDEESRNSIKTASNSFIQKSGVKDATDDEKRAYTRDTGHFIRETLSKQNSSIVNFAEKIQTYAIDKPKTWIMRKIQKLRNWADKNLADIDKMPVDQKGILTSIKKKVLQAISFLTSLLSEKGRNEEDIDYTKYHDYGYSEKDSDTAKKMFERNNIK